MKNTLKDKETVNIGYKLLDNDYVAKIHILGANNEERSGLVDKNYAKFRTNRVFVEWIKHAVTGVKTKQMNSIFDCNFMYRVNADIVEPRYDTNMDEICTTGIHYFKTMLAVLSYRESLNGIPRSYNDQGSLMY